MSEGKKGMSFSQAAGQDPQKAENDGLKALQDLTSQLNNAKKVVQAKDKEILDIKGSKDAELKSAQETFRVMLEEQQVLNSDAIIKAQQAGSAEIERLKLTNIDLQQEVEAKEQDIKRIEGELRSTTAVLQQLARLRTDVQYAKLSDEAILNKLIDDRNNMQSHCSTVEAINAQLQGQLRSQAGDKVSFDRLRDECDQKSQVVSRLKAEIKGLQAEKASLLNAGQLGGAPAEHDMPIKVIQIHKCSLDELEDTQRNRLVANTKQVFQHYDTVLQQEKSRQGCTTSCLPQNATKASSTQSAQSVLDEPEQVVESLSNIGPDANHFLKEAISVVRESEQLTTEIERCHTQADFIAMQSRVGKLTIKMQTCAKILGLQDCKPVPILIVGFQNFGKSLLMNCFTKMWVAYSERMRATKCPVEYQLEHDDQSDQLCCAVSTDLRDLEHQKRNPISIQEVARRVEDHMKGIATISKEKLYVHIRGRAIQYSAILIDLPGPLIQENIGVGQGAAQKNAQEAEYQKTVAAIIEDTLRESDELGALVLCVEKFGNGENDGYFLPVVSKILDEQGGTKKHRIIPIRTHHDISYAWKINNGAVIDRNDSFSTTVKDAATLAGLYTKSLDNGQSQFGYILSLAGVKREQSAVEMQDCLELNTAALINGFHVHKQHMLDALNDQDKAVLETLDPARCFSFDAFRDDVILHCVKHFAASFAGKYQRSLRSLLRCAQTHRSDLELNMRAVNLCLPGVLQSFWQNFKKNGQGQTLFGLPPMPVDFDASNPLHNLFPRALCA